MHFLAISTHVKVIVSDKQGSIPTDLSTHALSPVTCGMYLTNQHELIKDIIFLPVSISKIMFYIWWSLLGDMLQFIGTQSVLAC